MPSLNESFLELLRCPENGQKLRMSGGSLENEDGSHAYEISSGGIPLFAKSFCSEDAMIQQKHYDNVAKNYFQNLEYPHTQVYNENLDQALIKMVGDGELGVVAELCCGQGESFQLFSGRIKHGVGVDVSLNMLEAARQGLNAEQFLLIQGDATKSPLSAAAFDGVFMLGGIHHVNDRLALFREVARILKPGGFFYWREPVSDFFLWRWLRAIIYRLSPALDNDTEEPLIFKKTAPVLKQAGLELAEWKTFGFFGYCLFMNSDVLMFNRLFRFLPGIRGLTRFAVAMDRLTIKIPGLGHAGLMVIGKAKKNE